MDNWIIENVDYQNKALNSLLEHLKECVEIGDYEEIEQKFELDDFSEKFFPIKYEDIINDNLNINEIDFNEDEINIKQNVFSLKFFEGVFKEIKMYEICNNVIIKDVFVEVFLKHNLYDSKKSKFFSLNLQKMDFHNFSNFLDYFVFSNVDIEIKENSNENSKKNDENNNENNDENYEFYLVNCLMTILLLINYSTVNENECNQIKNNNLDKIYKGNLMKKEDFLNIKYSFEEQENFNEQMEILFDDEKDIQNYNKKRKLKELLFNINKINDDEINIEVFFDIISLKNITKALEPKEIEITPIKYLDLFFNNN